MKGFIKYFWLNTVIMLIGCSAPPTPLVNLTNDNPPQKHLVVLFDGTANDPDSNTNVWQMFELFLQDSRKNNVSSFYIEGVGAKNKIIGMAMGWGTGYRVRKGYSFLLQNYTQGDKVYLIGFSRGAYQARILASMLYCGGLPTKDLSIKDYDQFSDDVYKAFKGEQSGEQRRDSIQNVADLTPVNIEFLGLWDTVEALGTPDYEENTNLPNPRYGDQLCNVRKAAHAVSLDDNRANIFTPILLTKAHLVSDCDIPMGNKVINSTTSNIQEKLDAIVTEVWFSGAHADVGGGYSDSALNGVSLNWMIKQLNQVEPSLLANAQAKESDPNGIIHEPEKDLFGGAIYKKKMRSLYSYTGQTLYNNGYLKIHKSAILRLQQPEQVTGDQPRQYEWWLIEQFPRCFIANQNNGYNFIGDGKNGCNIEVVN